MNQKEINVADISVKELKEVAATVRLFIPMYARIHKTSNDKVYDTLITPLTNNALEEDIMENCILSDNCRLKGMSLYLESVGLTKSTFYRYYRKLLERVYITFNLRIVEA